LSSEELAGIMFETLQEKILPLADDVMVYPAHGPGSSCGKNLGSNTFSTIGEERKTNYALKPQSKEDFIAAVTNGLTAAPVYFAINANINQSGYEAIDAVIAKGTTPLSLDDFKAAMAADALVLDTRPAALFTKGFIPGSIFIGLEGRFAEWAGMLLPFKSKIILVTEKGKEEETVTRLARVGFENVAGYLKGSFETWNNAGETIDLIVDVEADELMMDIPHDPKLLVVDVRREQEFEEGHLDNALILPLQDMTDPALLAQFEDDQNLYIHCAGGYRSVIAASLMKKEGIHNLRNVLGGWNSIRIQEKAQIVKDTEQLK
jgi:rhodanese-related sulfurtransferase